jgi:hypothetical protein
MVRGDKPVSKAGEYPEWPLRYPVATVCRAGKKF